MTLQLFPLLLVPLVVSLSAASGVVDEAEIVAKEAAALQSLKYGLDVQISQLRKAHDAKMNAKNALLQKLETELSQLHVAVDEAQSRLEEHEKKSKALASGGGLESATKDLRKTLEAFEARPRKNAVSADSMRAYRDEVEETIKVLKRSSETREEAGAFKLKDGTVKQGGIKWFGETSVFGRSENGLVPLGPDGVGGWFAAPKTVVFSDLRSKLDVSASATAADRLAGLIPILWLTLLGLAVSWLFVAIAKQ